MVLLAAEAAQPAGDAGGNRPAPKTTRPYGRIPERGAAKSGPDAFCHPAWLRRQALANAPPRFALTSSAHRLAKSGARLYIAGADAADVPDKRTRSNGARPLARFSPILFHPEKALVLHALFKSLRLTMASRNDIRGTDQRDGIRRYLLTLGLRLRGRHAAALPPGAAREYHRHHERIQFPIHRVAPFFSKFTAFTHALMISIFRFSLEVIFQASNICCHFYFQSVRPAVTDPGSKAAVGMGRTRRCRSLRVIGRGDPDDRPGSTPGRIDRRKPLRLQGRTDERAG